MQDFTADLTEEQKNFIIKQLIKTAGHENKQQLLNDYTLAFPKADIDKLKSAMFVQTVEPVLVFPKVDTEKLKSVVIDQKNDEALCLVKVKNLLESGEFRFVQGTGVEIISFDPNTVTIHVEVVGAFFNTWSKFIEYLYKKGIKHDILIRLDGMNIVITRYLYEKNDFFQL